MKFKKNTLILIFLFTFLIAVLMSLEEFFEGELSAEGALEEVIVYLLILGTLLLTIVTPAYRVVKRFNQKLPLFFVFSLLGRASTFASFTIRLREIGLH